MSSATRTIRPRPRGWRQRTCTILKKLLQNHTRCNRWKKRRDSESLHAEFAAAGWAWLGPALLVRACGGSEHGDDEGLTPGQRRKLSLDLAGKRAKLAGTCAWMELLRVYVRDLLSHEVDARGDGTRTLQRSSALKADRMRASDKVDSCNVRAAWRILQANTRAPQNSQTAADIHSLVAVEADELETARITVQCAAIKQGEVKHSPSTGKTGQAHGEGSRAGGGTGPPWMAQRGHCGRRTL